MKKTTYFLHIGVDAENFLKLNISAATTQTAKNITKNGNKNTRKSGYFFYAIDHKTVYKPYTNKRKLVLEKARQTCYYKHNKTKAR